MSIMNCFVSPNRALVSVDTLAGIAGGPTGHVAKLVPFPQASSVIAARGEQQFFGSVATALNLSFASSYDGLAAAMSQALAQTYELRVAFNEKHGGGYPFAGVEIGLVGWSASCNRMLGCRWERWPGDEGFRATPIDPWSMSPNPGYDELPAAPDTAERMEVVARDQFARLRSLPFVVTGGRLLVAELTRELLTVRTVADLGVQQ